MKKHSESSVYVCVHCYACVSVPHSHSAVKAANEYYALHMITPITSWNTVLYISTEHQTLLAAVDQLVPVSFSFKTGILQESVLVFDPFHWNGIIIISINNYNCNNNNIKNIQIMDTEVIQNTLRWNKEKWKRDTTIRHASKQLCLARKQFCCIIKTSQWK